MLARTNDLVAGYGNRPAIEGVTFEVDPGQRVALLGPNGGGKTTLLRALLGELRPMRGNVEVHGRAATVPQTERSKLDFPVSALEVALMGALPRLAWWRRPATPTAMPLGPPWSGWASPIAPTKPSAISPGASASGC